MSGFAKILLGILLILVLIAVVKFSKSKESKPESKPESKLESKPELKPSEWQCLPGFNVPIRREANAEQDISCMSEDAVNCLWTSDSCPTKLQVYSKPEMVNKIKPLFCGAMAKSIYGITGYEESNPNHWCYIGNKSIGKK